MSAKATLRAELRLRRRRVERAEVERASAAVCARLAALPEVARDPLALYAGVDGEIEVDALAAAHAGGVIYPRIAGDDLRFHRVAGRGELTSSLFGLFEPAPERAEVALADAAAVVVPGVAFDRSGRRLGQGRGFYDRALAAAPRPLRIGVCHDFQLVAEVPADAHDERMDIVVTPSETLRPTHGGIR